VLRDVDEIGTVDDVVSCLGRAVEEKRRCYMRSVRREGEASPPPPLLVDRLTAPVRSEPTPDLRLRP
jgi:hypothetical protein